MVPEDLLSEPVDDGVMEVCDDVLDAGLRSSCASSTLERDLEGRETDLDRPGPMEVGQDPSTLEVATAENLDPKDGVDTCPGPEDVAKDDLARVGSVSHCPAPEVLSGMIRLRWAVQTMTQPPRGSEWGLPPILPWTFMWDRLHTPAVWW
jgi:hypothetical protein